LKDKDIKVTITLVIKQENDKADSKNNFLIMYN